VTRFRLLFPALIGALLVAGATRAAEDLPLSELENRRTFLIQRILDQERAIQAMEQERRAAKAESRLPRFDSADVANQPRPGDPPYVRGLFATLRPQTGKPTITNVPPLVWAATVRINLQDDEQRARAFLDLLEDELTAIDQEIQAIDLFGRAAPTPTPAPTPVVKQLRIETTFPEIAPGTKELLIEVGGITHLKAQALVERGGSTEWQDWTTHVRWHSDSAGVSVASTGAVRALVHVASRVTIRARSGAIVTAIPLRVIRPAISITKTSNPPGAFFDTDTNVTFQFEVTNTGDRRLFDVDVQDSVCSPATPASGRPSLDPGQSVTLSCTMKVKRTAVLTSSASVWARYQPSGLRNYVSATTTHTLDVRQGPDITFVSHSEGDRVSTPTIVLRGTANDAGRGDDGVHAVLVDRSQANQGTSTGANPVNWSKELSLAPGKNKFMVEAYDASSDFNLTRRYINLYYDPVKDPSLVDLRIEPDVDSLDVGQEQTFVAIAVYQDGTERNVTNADDTRWVPGNPVQPDAAGPLEVTVIYKGRMATILIGVEGPPPDPPVGGPQDPDGLPGGIFNILFKPDGTGRPRCFQFMLARVGGDFLASPGVLTPASTRSGWSVDSFAGAGPYQGWTWADPLRANARMMDLSVYGGDWYGCRQPPRWVSPTVGTGQVSPIPPGMPEYGIWRRNRLNFPPNCFEFAAAPIAEAERYDGKNGYVREPSFFGPWAQIDVSKITSQLSPYEGDFYGCFTGPTPESLSIDPSSAEIPWGGNLSLVAIAVNDDGTTTDVTAEASWSHALPIQGDVPGTYLVTASYRGLEASAQVTVLPPRLTALVVTTDADEIKENQTAYFRAIATFEDGSERDVTDDADWHPHSWVNPTNLDPITARATYRGQTASKTVTVVAAPPAQTASFQILGTTISGLTGGPPVKGNPVVVNAKIRVGAYDGLAAWECRRSSDGHYGPGVQITSVSAGAEIPVRCEFPELPLQGHPFGDAITITVSDGGDVTESLNAPFSWQDSDTFSALAFEDTRSGKGGRSFDVGAQLQATSSWKIDPHGSSSRVIRYTAGGQTYHEEPVGVTPGSDFTHTAPPLPITRSMKGSIEVQVLLVRSQGDHQVGAAKLRIEVPEDEILSAAVLTGQGGSITAGATAFVAVQVKTAEGLEGTRTLELQGRGRGSLGVQSFSSKGGEVVSKSLTIDTTGQDPGIHRLKIVLTDPGGNTDRTQTSYTIDEPPAQPPSRRTGGLVDVVCQEGNITIGVRDHMTLDGDIISVALGNDLLTSGLNLDSCGGGCSLRNVTLAPGEALPLSVLAHNTGSYGPNTAELSVQGGCSPTTQPWELQTNESAAIWIRRP
jgi:hypothetical protein